MSYNNGLSNHNINGNGHSSGDGGSTSSSTYQNVSYKKQQGTLILNENGYTFYPISNGGGNGSNNNNNTNNVPMKQTWLQVTKHQVSPASHARHLLKLVLQSPQQQQQLSGGPGTPSMPSPSKKKSKPLSDTFEFKTREDVERIRKDVSHRLVTTRKIHALNNSNINNNNNPLNSSYRKRTHDEMNYSSTSALSPSPMSKSGTHFFNQNDESIMSMPTASSTSTSSTSPYAYTHLNKSQFKVASCSLLASYPTLRTQHSLLLQPPSQTSSSSTSTSTTLHNNNNNNNDSTDTPIISNDVDFWSTHSIQQSHQFSKIIGVISRGLPSTIKSSLDIQLTTANTTATTKKKDTSSDSGKGKDESSGGTSGGGGNTSSSGGGGLGGGGSAITLGVEEMKQIFIMYPAVHAAYEEKVPLELSEELFWRKYLESEYFHRDRGKLGMSARQAHMFLSGSSSGRQQKKDGGGKTKGGGGGDDDDDDGEDKEDDDDGDDGDGDIDGVGDKKDDQKKVDETARVATASSNDIFSRKELELQRLRQQQQRRQEEVLRDGKLEAPLYSHLSSRKSNKSIAVGQFDLTSTANTERGSKLLLNTNDDLHPSSDCGKKVIEKYNKHWAMVLNPNDAVAGCDLSALARKSVRVVLDGDDDANAKGGIDKEMKRLVNSAAAAAAASDNLDNEDGGDNVKTGAILDDHYYYGDNVLFEELALKNINAYSGNFSPSGVAASLSSSSLEQLRIECTISNQALAEIKPLLLVEPKNRSNDAFPDRKFGTMILQALTKKIVMDSKTEKDAVKMTNELPQDFRKDFTKLYRRSSELLRHFFALRRLVEIEKKKLKLKGSGNHRDDSRRNGHGDENGNGSSSSSSSTNTSKQSSQKLERISTGLEDVYREMESMKNALPSSELGEKMRKMFIPVMDQLDWASKLHKEGLDSIGNRGVKKPAFGFVDVTD